MRKTNSSKREDVIEYEFNKARKQLKGIVSDDYFEFLRRCGHSKETIEHLKKLWG